MVTADDAPKLIYPPPEVRNIVDKTAGFVARNGQEFEHRIKQNEVNNPKFNFLNPGDPYHAYYQHKVVQIREGKPEVERVDKKGPAEVSKKQAEVIKAIAHKKEEPLVPKEPPPEYEFLADPPSISAFDLDVVKLTAQFVARNGRQFLTQLMNREQRNYQFDFLRPQHSLFQYFTRLLEQYTKVLLPPKELQGKLDAEAGDKTKVLDQVNWRVAWQRQEEAAKRKQEEALERERVAYAQIDWHNFVVVETVDYQPWEVGNFPPPTNPTEVGARVLIQRRQEEHGPAPTAPADSDSEEEEEATAGADTQVQDMEEGSSSEEEDEPVEQTVEDPKKTAEAMKAVPAPPMPAPPVQPPPIQAPLPGSVVVKKYDPKAAAAVRKKTEEDQFLISPLTGEKIPAGKVAEHMKVGLLDPKWLEERDKQIISKSNEEVVFAPGQAIESNLKLLAERRSDIFGVGEEAAQETYIGQKIGEEEQRVNEKNTWDGHSSSAEAAARAARKDITLNDQIAQIHKQKGLIPDRETKTVAVTLPPQQQPPMQQQQPPQQNQMQMIRPMMGMPGMGMPGMRPQMMVHQPMFMQQQNMPRPLFMQHPGPGGPRPGGPGGPGGPGMQHQRGGVEEPPAKKQKTEENLIPEPEFIANNPSPVTFKISVPKMADKPEWKLNGQMLTLTYPLEETITTIKAKINDLTGM
ncbi:splicing factor 3A subunit 1-like isoform X2 [Eurytemora carolleeae]|nr:splicing factor 3A subunit 1-like isoform X2 [Eurytemora carolleeae]|eukprot:XP_023330282.1 splicing factor 3A subunit 1-like isoform X2 [Eurytemora affinis]